MTVFTAVPRVTSVALKALDVLYLPFVPHVLGTMDDSAFNAVLVSDDDKYVVKSIEGLEPPGRDIAIASTAAGGHYQGLTVEDREVVALIGLYPDFDKGESYELLRQNLYTLLNPGYDPKVDIQLLSGPFNHSHEFGYVSKFEAAIFDQNPAVQITFTMLNPTFHAFQPFSYDASELSEKAPDVYNQGTAETGFKFSVKFTDTMNGWSIKQAEDQSIGMVFDMTFHDGDVLNVSTIPGQKFVHYKPHRKKVQNKMSALTNGSEWIQLHPGHNHFVLPPKTGRWDWNGKLSFTPQYWGI